MYGLDFFKEMDERHSCCGITRKSNYYRTTDSALTTDSCSSGPAKCVSNFISGASYIAMLVWTAVAAVLHIVGCPASVTSLSCCNSGLRYITSIWSWLYSHSWRENYDEVSGSAEGDMRPMVTAGVRPIGLPANILRPGNGYERVSMSDVPETQENSRGKKNTTIDVDNGPTIDL